MKKSLLLTLSFTSLTATAAPPDFFLAEVRRNLGRDCQDPLSRAEIEKNLESAAYQQCHSAEEELELSPEHDVFHQIKLCGARDEHSLVIDQRLFSCVPRPLRSSSSDRDDFR